MTTTTETPEGEARTLPRRQQIYREKVIAALRSEFDYPNPMMVPRIECRRARFVRVTRLANEPPALSPTTT